MRTDAAAQLAAATSLPLPSGPARRGRGSAEPLPRAFVSRCGSPPSPGRHASA